LLVRLLGENTYELFFVNIIMRLLLLGVL